MTVFNGFIRSEGGQFDLGDVTLGSSTTLDSTNQGTSPGGANLNFNKVLGSGTQNLSLNSGTVGSINAGIGGLTGV